MFILCTLQHINFKLIMMNPLKLVFSVTSISIISIISISSTYPLLIYCILDIIEITFVQKNITS